ncbi:MAG: hypothetical protein RLZZ22_149 [Pseudomonadota bacterium]|jgi:hypothetical protein
MSAINNGGPAFPTESAHQSSSSTWHHEGMTLRDYFAAKASEEDIAEYMPATMGEARLHPNRTRQWARYQHADAMLRAREAK